MAISISTSLPWSAWPGFCSRSKPGLETSVDGRTRSAQLEAIRADILRLLDEIYSTYRDELVGALAANGIRIADYESLADRQPAQLESYFLDRIYPVLTPLAFDPGRRHISNLRLNLAVVVRDAKGSEHFARVKVPDSIPQLIPIPKDSDTPVSEGFVWIEQVIVANLQSLFRGWEIVDAHAFHVTRDAEVAIKW